MPCCLLSRRWARGPTHGTPAWPGAAGRALGGLAWDSATAELGSGGLGPEKFPRLQEERPAAALPGAGMMAKMKPQERRRRRLGAQLPPSVRLQPRSPSSQTSQKHESCSLHPSQMVPSSVGFFLNGTLELCLDLFLQGELGGEDGCLSSEYWPAPCSWLWAGLATGETKGERGSAGSSRLLPRGCACAAVAPTAPQPRQGRARGQVALSRLAWCPPTAVFCLLGLKGSK